MRGLGDDFQLSASARSFVSLGFLQLDPGYAASLDVIGGEADRSRNMRDRSRLTQNRYLLRRLHGAGVRVRDAATGD